MMEQFVSRFKWGEVTFFLHTDLVFLSVAKNKYVMIYTPSLGD